MSQGLSAMLKFIADFFRDVFFPSGWVRLPKLLASSAIIELPSLQVALPLKRQLSDTFNEGFALTTAHTPVLQAHRALR